MTAIGTALTMMLQGMVGLFIVMGAIALIVYLMGKFMN